MKPLKIGPLTIENPVLLAPMAGYTDIVFRPICLRFRCGLVYTELVSAEGLIHDSARTMVFLHTVPEERPIAAHLYGSNPDSMARAAELVESLGRFDLIDINCGCPARKIAGKGSGVTLMRDPEKIHTMVRMVSQGVSLPVMVKTRIGISPDLYNISEVAQAVEEGGGSAIAIHARFATARHSGPVNLEALKQIKQERTIPVIGNGGITSGTEALHMVEQTGVDAVMIGKGAIGNPWVFEEIRCALDGVPYITPSNEKRLAIMTEHIKKLHQLILSRERSRKKPAPNIQRVTAHAFRGHLGKYLHGVAGINRLQGGLMQIETIDGVIDNIREILQVEEQSV